MRFIRRVKHPLPPLLSVLDSNPWRKLQFVVLTEEVCVNHKESSPSFF